MSYKKALLLLDLQNDIVHADGKFGKLGFAAQVAKRGVLANAARLLGAARMKGIPVVHVRVGYRPDYEDCFSRSGRKERMAAAGALQAGTWGCEFPFEVAPGKAEVILTKQSVNPFVTTPLAAWLSSRGIEEVLLAGVSTNMVVETTARTADDLGYAVTVIEDCCASNADDMHAFAIAKILPGCGRVISSVDAIRDM